MAKPYRSRTRVLLDLLRAVQAEEPAQVTRLLFVANLSHPRLKEYLDELEDKGWIAETGAGAEGRKAWTMTSAGHGVLAEMRRVEAVMEDYGLWL